MQLYFTDIMIHNSWVSQMQISLKTTDDDDDDDDFF